MTNERIVQVIAKADGFLKIFYDEWGPLRGFKDNTSLVYVVPSYLTSHDAIIPAVVKWCGDDNERWQSFLYALISRTPEQLSIALVKAMGKWEE